jgi:DNA-binding SARP family transcriptional activator/tetratricopeptide (TPR) repeat protein
VEFHILGPLEICVQGRPIDVGTPRTRAVLAVLLAQPGTVVSVDRFVDELWPDRPPPDARALIHGQVSRVRRALRGAGAADRLVTRKPGYLLRVEDGELDVHRFERLVGEARTARQAGDLERCLELFARAHRLWRGTPLADVPSTPAIAGAVTAMTEQRLTTLEERFAVAIDAGHDADVVAELTELVNAHPLRERFVAQLTRALYCSGRTADALNAYQKAKKQLADELGVAPGPELQQLELAILRGEPSPETPPPSPRTQPPRTQPPRTQPPPAQPPRTQPPRAQPPPPAQLPASVTGFSGRADQIAQLDAMLDGAGAVVISAVSGTAGVGKTALAIHWAHRVAAQFPDGQLYVNLRGFDPSGSVMSPTDAVRGFLDALGVAPQRIPADIDAQAALYRSLLAGRRVLVVLDNARDADQVRPLLPGSPTCLAVVTSRDQLTDLVAAEGARPITLDLLSAAESRQLLARRIGADRIAAEPDAVDDIVERCARLPLALSIVAARAATHPRFRLATLADELCESLDALNRIRSVFSWSYQALSPAAARLFRLLGLHPGPDISVPAAASLAGTAVNQARNLLAELAGANLVTEHLPGRYTMHDLLRTYARETAHACDTEQVRQSAVRQVLDHYLYTAHAADRLLGPPRGPSCLPFASPASDVRQEQMATDHEAMAWLSVEHRVLLAVLRLAADAGMDTHAWQLAWCLDTFLYRGGHWHDQINAWQTALTAARRLGDLAAQGTAHRSIGRANTRLGDDRAAHIHLRLALELETQAGYKLGQADTHCMLAYLAERQGHLEKALRHNEQALSLYQAIGNRVGEANTLNGIGWHHALLGDYHRALVYCGRALPMLRQLGRRTGEAGTWHSLGYAHYRLGDSARAIECYQHSLALLRDTGDRYHRAEGLTHLGDASYAVGDAPAARAAWQQALDILKELDHPDAEMVQSRLLRGTS